MDPAITTGGIYGLLTVVKAITGIAKDVNNIELNRQISEIQLKIFEVQEKLMALQDENMRLRDENRQIKAAAELQESVVPHDQAIWKLAGDGREEGPFCPSCWADGKLRPAQIDEVEGGEVHFACRQHTNPYYFRVPERLVKIGDLSSYKQSGVSYYGGARSSGPDEWVG